jgi:hypothetical protein
VVFTPNHFKDLASRDAVASALKRHKQSGLISSLPEAPAITLKSIPSWGPLEPPTDD